MKKNNIMTGALLLSIGGVLAKIFSAIYRIGLTRILGGEGIGLYQLIFPLYSLCVVLATAGLPMAISKVIAKNPNKERSVMKKCISFISVVALVFTLVLIVLSGPLSLLQSKKSLTICYIILAPSIVLVSFSSVLKGYFQGVGYFVPSTVSNIVEQLIKLVAGLVLSLALISKGLIPAIIGTLIGIDLSEIVALIILILFYRKADKNNEEFNLSTKEILKDILPITITNIILPIATFIDSLIVVNLLKVNYSTDVSIYLYGLESGAVASLVSLPTIFSFAIATVILPSLTTASSLHNKKTKLALAVKIILIITIPCLILFTLIPNEIIGVLYSNKLSGLGIDGSDIASKLLTISGFGVVFLSLNQIFSSTLQAMDKRRVTIRNLLIAVGAKFIIELIFLPSKMLNIYSLAVANTVCYIIAMTLNYTEIQNELSMNVNYKFAEKLILANSVVILILNIGLGITNSNLKTILIVGLSAIIYLVVLCIVKIFNKKDLAMVKLKGK